MAIGANSVANQANTVSVGAFGGARRVVNVAAGTATTDAVNFGQLATTNANVTSLTTGLAATNVTVASQGTAITAIQTLNTQQSTQIAGLQAFDTAVGNRVSALESLALDFDDRLDNVDDRASAGSVVAIALGGNSFLPGKQFNLTGNVGTYRGAVAAAVQFGALVGEGAAVNAGVAKGFNRDGKVGARVGFTFGW